MWKSGAARSSTRVGVATIITTVFGMALADALIKQSSTAMTLWQIYVLRSALVVPILLAMARGRMNTGRYGWIALRSLALVLMYLGIYAAIPWLELSVVAAALYTSPLFIAGLSAIVLRERITSRHWLGILIGFAGVLLIVRPAASGFKPLALVPVGAAFLYAVAAVITRAKCSDMPTRALAVWLNLGLLVTGLAASLCLSRTGVGAGFHYPFLFDAWQPMSGRDGCVIVVLACLMIGISLGLARAYQSPRPQVIATFDYSFLIFATFWGFVFFGDIPDRLTLLGMGLIMLAGVIVLTAGTPEPTRPEKAKVARDQPLVPGRVKIRTRPRRTDTSPSNR